MLRLLLPAVLLPVLAFAAPAGPPDDLPARAASLADRLAGVEVALPDGSMVAVIASDEGSPTAGRPPALLTRDRLRIALETVSAAQAWPAAWLVVQRKELDVDLVARIELADDGEIVTPEFLFVTPRRNWEVEDVSDVARQATGRKPPRKGRFNVVLQGFSTTVETTYVYDTPPPAAGERGLLSLLPEGSLLREAQSVTLPDGTVLTLALVLEDAVFVPSDCADCADELFGHADSGTIRLVLAGGAGLVESVDLTPHLRGIDGRPLLPRYPCDGGALDSAAAHRLLATGQPLPLLKLIDQDGDGHALELELPAKHVDCGRYMSLIVWVHPDGTGLQILGQLARPPGR